jgi:hypothetical protein
MPGKLGVNGVVVAGIKVSRLKISQTGLSEILNQDTRQMNHLPELFFSLSKLNFKSYKRHKRTLAKMV